MALENIREISGRTSTKDLSDLVVGERILLKGFETDTHETAGVVVWKQRWGEHDKFLVASRNDIKTRSDPNFSPINCMLYIRHDIGSEIIKDPNFPYQTVNCDSEGGMKRSITKELAPGHSLSFPNTAFAEYNAHLENVGL